MREAQDASYYQETFYFTILISMSKDVGGSRDETKNDIRALPEVLTVTLIEQEKGGIQRDLGTKYLSTLKLHVRLPKGASKELMMKRLVLLISNLRGISVLRYKERKPKQRRKAFHGTYKIDERAYQQSPSRKRRLSRAFNRLTTRGPNDSGPFKAVKKKPSWKSAPPGAPGGGAFGLEEIQLDEAMKTPADLPEDVVVVVDKQKSPEIYKIYFASTEWGGPRRPLKAHDLDRMERGIDIYGTMTLQLGHDFPYEGHYVVESIRAQDGYGPLLYDVALETVGKAGLKPDVLKVSSDASNIWKHYNSQRPDVESKLLVMDLDQYHTVMPPEHAKRPEDNEHLAKAYFKTDRATLKELNTIDKLVEIHTAAPEAPKTPSQDKDLGRFDRLYEDVLITIGAQDDLMAFDIQADLNQKIWDGEKGVRSGVKGALMDIVEEFLEGLDLEAEVKDIIITGSIANYNWSKFSDIDLHILIDFAEVNENTEMVKKFFDSVRSNWNKLHDIRVKGHEVEIYVQDEKEPHVSTGVYSLLNDRWLVKPKKVRPSIDRYTATKKMKAMAREIDKLSATFDMGAHEAAFLLAGRIKEKIKRMRQSGLERTGIYSPENLAFKMLRRSGDIEQLFSIYTQAYDKMYSLDQ